MRNVDAGTVASFGEEWTTFDQANVPPQDLDAMFAEYFRIFPWHELPTDAEGVDAGCGSGRWAARVAPRVGRLHCVDASAEALDRARLFLADQPRCVFHHASVADMPLKDESMDFAYSLGVLHHLPDAADAVAACVRKLKPGAPLLVYVYYALENRPAWFRALWWASDVLRQAVSRLPLGARSVFASVAATVVYLPLARTARALERKGYNVETFPLSYYRHRSLFTMRTDARDRFGTPLERRMTRDHLVALMQAAGLAEIVVSPEPPYWCAVGRRAAASAEQLEP